MHGKLGRRRRRTGQKERKKLLQNGNEMKCPKPETNKTELTTPTKIGLGLSRIATAIATIKPVRVERERGNQSLLLLQYINKYPL